MGIQLTRNWLTILLRGVVAIFFGILAIFWPGITLTVLVLAFAAYALIDGIFAVVSALRHNTGEGHWWLLLEGVVSIIAAVLTVFLPGVTAIILIYTIAAWAVLTGFFELLSAFELRKTMENEWLLIVNGILSLIFGLLIAIYPTTGALTIAWLIGVYSVLFGCVLVGLGLRLRQRHSALSDTFSSINKMI